MSARAADTARRNLEYHALRLDRQAEAQQARAGGSRLSALASLAESRRIPLSQAVAAADKGELRSIVEMPDVNRARKLALARLEALDARRRSWTT